MVSLTVTGGTTAELVGNLEEVLNRFKSSAAPLPAIAGPAPFAATAPRSGLAKKYQFDRLNVVDLSEEQVRRFMAPLNPKGNTTETLRRIIKNGSPEFSVTLLDLPTRPGTYYLRHTAITRRLRKVTQDPTARLFGWIDDGAGIWAMSEASFESFKKYFDSIG